MCEGSLPVLRLYQPRQESLHFQLPPGSYSARDPEPCCPATQALCWPETTACGSACCYKPQVPISTMPAPMLPAQPSPAAIRGQAELGAGACGGVCGGSAASLPCLGVQLCSWRVSRTAEEMFASTFLLLQAPCSIPLSVEWGFSALPPPVKLGASTTCYCSPPFRASLEALLWESEFLQLFVLVRADLSPSWCLGLIVGPELTSRFVAGVCH